MEGHGEDREADGARAAHPAPELDVGRVGLHHGEALGTQGGDAGRVVLDAHDVHAVVVAQLPHGAAADPAHAEHERLRPGHVDEPLLAVQPLVGLGREALGQRHRELVAARVDRGGQHEAGGDGDGEDHEPLVVQQAGLRADGDHDQAELGVVGQHQPRQDRGAFAQPHQAQQHGRDDGLQRQHQQQEQPDDRGLPAQLAGEADRDEEADQQQLLDGEQVAGQLGGGGVAGQQHAHDERAEVALEPDGLEQRVARTERDGHAEQGLQLAVAHPRPDLAQQPGARDQEHEGERPRARRVVGGHGQEDDGDQVLHDEHADGDPAVEGGLVGAAVEHLDHEHRGRERQGEPEQREHAQALAREHREPDHAEQAEEPDGDGDADQQVRDRREPDVPAQQGLDVQLEADAEQQQRHAEVGDGAQVGRLGDAGGVEREPGHQEADQGRQPEQHRPEPGRDRSHQKDRCRRHGQSLVVACFRKPPPQPAVRVKGCPCPRPPRRQARATGPWCAARAPGGRACCP